MDFFNRRTFLRLGGMSLAFTVAGSAAARRLTTPRRRDGDPVDPPPGAKAQTDTPLLLTIFLRGGADGLNIAIPTESNEFGLYRSFRRTIGVDAASIDAAGTRLTDAGGADLQWALHPRGVDFMPLWTSGMLAILPDVHYDNGSRSHFDSQQFYENGTPYDKFTPDGWANRALSSSAGPDPILRAVAFETFTPFSLQGSYPTLTFSNLRDLSVSGDIGRNNRYLNMQEAVYPTALVGTRTYDAEVSVAGSSLVEAIRRITGTTLPDTDGAAQALYDTILETAPGRRGPNAYFAERLIDLGKLIRSNAFAIEMAEIDLHGWDTHQSQDINANGHPNLVETLARCLRAFTMDLGNTFTQNTVIQVYSEFGRTTRENGSYGTDHGSATVAFVVGHSSKVLGRRVIHGPAGWYGLADLRDDRDLKHSTDYRNIIAEVVSRHMGNSSPDLFPGWTPQPVGVMA